jgi:hypothetical protein
MQDERSETLPIFQNKDFYSYSPENTTLRKYKFVFFNRKYKFVLFNRKYNCIYTISVKNIVIITFSFTYIIADERSFEP